MFQKAIISSLNIRLPAAESESQATNENTSILAFVLNLILSFTKSEVCLESLSCCCKNLSSQRCKPVGVSVSEGWSGTSRWSGSSQFCAGVQLQIRNKQPQTWIFPPKGFTVTLTRIHQWIGLFFSSHSLWNSGIFFLAHLKHLALFPSWETVWKLLVVLWHHYKKAFFWQHFFWLQSGVVDVVKLLRKQSLVYSSSHSGCFWYKQSSFWKGVFTIPLLPPLNLLF